MSSFLTTESKVINAKQVWLGLIMITAIKYDCYILRIITAKQGSYCERSMTGMISSSLEFFYCKNL